MAAQAARWSLRVLIVVAICVALFYVGRPLYWKLSATLQDLWHQQYQAIKPDASDLVQEARKIG